MPLRIACPEGHTLIVSQARGGSTLRCPKCGSPVTVPGAPPASAAVATSRPAVAAAEETLLARVAVFTEPEPPPVVAQPQEVVAPPVWSPPPKSRAIVEPVPQPVLPPEPPVPPDPPRSEPQEGAPEPVLPEIAAAATDKLDDAATTVRIPEPDAVPELDAIPEPEATPEPEAEIPTETQPDEPPADPPLIEPPILHSPPVSRPDAVDSVDAPALRPLIPSPRQRLTACLLALSLAAAALFGSGPALWDVMQFSQAAEGGFIPRWAFVSLALAGVQIAYAVYFAQLPDWLSGWVVTLVSLAMAALYAGMLGVTLIASQESSLIRSLELADVLGDGRAAMWCLCMTTIMASLAFFAGRASFRWRQAAAW